MPNPHVGPGAARMHHQRTVKRPNMRWDRQRVITRGGGPPLTTEPPIVATGATAGAPGTWTPAGSVAPATNADMAGITATPPGAWTIGQYMACHDLSETYWNGSAWTTGRAP